jgi:phosphohistidine phosphatase SixA
MIMKYVLIFLTILGIHQSITAQEEPGVTKIFIVRHAEKVTGKEAGKDPLLTAAGKIRSGDLMRRLQHEGIQKIYVSLTRRSQDTADSLRIQLHIDTVHYTADTLCDNLVGAILEHRDFGKTILIIAHSNTIPQIIRKLGVQDYPYGDIPDSDYDQLFIITYRNEKAKLKVMKYGAESGTPAAMQ